MKVLFQNDVFLHQIAWIITSLWTSEHEENSHSKDEGPIPSSLPRNGDVRSLSLAKEKKPAYSNVMRRPGKQPKHRPQNKRRIQSLETLRGCDLKVTIIH